MTGIELKKIRKALQTTQQGLASLLDIDDTTISKYENEERGIPEELEHKLNGLIKSLDMRMTKEYPECPLCKGTGHTLAIKLQKRASMNNE